MRQVEIARYQGQDCRRIKIVYYASTQGTEVLEQGVRLYVDDKTSLDQPLLPKHSADAIVATLNRNAALWKASELNEQQIQREIGNLESMLK